MTSQTLAYPTRSVWGVNSVLKREFRKHSVEQDVKAFCGWSLLKDIVETASRVGVKGKRNAGFVAAMFNTGGRVSEVLALKPSNFRIFKGCYPPLVVVENMPLLKRYEKIGEYRDELGKRHYKTKRINAVRNTFSMRIDEPLIKPMLVWIVEAYKLRYKYLFPSPYKVNKPLTRKWAYQLIRKVGNRLGIYIYDHWFRAQRACQLFAEYEFREASLLEWFEWEKWETAKKYTRLGPMGLAKKMGVRFRRKRGLKPKQLEKLIVKED